MKTLFKELPTRSRKVVASFPTATIAPEMVWWCELLMVRKHDVTLVTRDQKDDSPMRQAKLMGCCDRSDKYRLHDELGVKNVWSFEEFTTRNQWPMPNALDQMTVVKNVTFLIESVRNKLQHRGLQRRQSSYRGRVQAS